MPALCSKFSSGGRLLVILDAEAAHRLVLQLMHLLRLERLRDFERIGVEQTGHHLFANVGFDFRA